MQQGLPNRVPVPRVVAAAFLANTPAPSSPAAPRPLTPTDIFNEAISYIPMIHVPDQRNQHALVIGGSAAMAAQVATRYPSFAEILVSTDIPLGPNHDPRVHVMPSLVDLPPSWKADLIVVAVPVITPDFLQSLRLHSHPRTIVTIAASTPNNVRILKDTMRRLWPVVMPYREHLPEPAFFLLASDSPIRRHRAVPPSARRLTEKYVPSLFTFAKDEYNLLYGAAS